MIRLSLAIAAAAALSLSVVPGWARDAVYPELYYPGLQTNALHFTGSGSFAVDAGFEYLPSITNEVAGIEGNLLRAPMIGLRYGLSDRAMFKVEWPVYNRIAITSKITPPPLGQDLGSVTTDVGDIVISTLFRLQPEAGLRPSWGIRFAAKLPNTNEKLGIGVNSTDVFASVLASKTLATRVRFHGDLGVGILTEPTQSFTQNDVLTYGFMTDYWIDGSLHAVGEVTGFHSTHHVGPGTRSSSELRAGLAGRFGMVDLSALLVRGLLARDSQGIGGAVHASFRIAAAAADQNSLRRTP